MITSNTPLVVQILGVAAILLIVVTVLMTALRRSGFTELDPVAKALAGAGIGALALAALIEGLSGKERSALAALVAVTAAIAVLAWKTGPRPDQEPIPEPEDEPASEPEPVQEPSPVPEPPGEDDGWQPPEPGVPSTDDELPADPDATRDEDLEDVQFR
jgi:hypothetical protein